MLAVEVEPQAQILHVADFVRRAQPWSAFAFGLLAAAFYLEGGALGDVMADAEARYDGGRIFFPQMIGAFTDNEGDLHHKVNLFRMP
ncbi:hypothetical protein D3C80_1748670 [compost metagenome]|jgi:hypothetical protein